jgi:hypothetical protein
MRKSERQSVNENGIAHHARIRSITSHLGKTVQRTRDDCPWASNLDVGRVNAHRMVASLARYPHNCLHHRAEGGRSPISDPASELRRVKPRRRDEKRVLDTIWSTKIPGPGVIEIFDHLCRFPVLGTVRKADRQDRQTNTINHSTLRDIN